MHKGDRTAPSYRSHPPPPGAGSSPVVHFRSNSTGNASEESGIFTQTSQDSVARATADSIVTTTQSGMPFVPLTNGSDPQSTARDEVTFSSRSDWDSAFENIMHVDTTLAENSEMSSALTSDVVDGG